MKKLLFLLIIVVFASCKDNKVRITGLVKNPTTNEIEVFYNKDFVVYERETYTFELNEHNEFIVRMPLDSSRFVYLRADKRTILLYLKPNSRIYVKFDMEKPDELPYISGHHAHESDFFLAYNNDIDKEFPRNILFEKLRESNAEEFTDFIQELKKTKLDYLHNYENFEMLDDEFVYIIEQGIKYESLSYLINYPGYHQMMNNLASLPEIPKGYYVFLKEEGLFDDSALLSSEYRNFLIAYLEYCTRENPLTDGSSELYFSHQFEIAANMLSGKSLDYVLSTITVNALNRADFETAESLFNQYLETAEPGPNRDAVKKQYDVVTNLLPGNPAPGFVFNDIDGNEVSLDDFDGKVVYLDFWASWCGPCIREIPYAKELKERMKEHDDLVFLYFSLDEDEEAWRKSVDTNEIQGVHLHAGGWRNSASLAYNVRAVPTFYLIGRDGKIFDNKPPRPSSPTIDEVLLQALEN